MNKNKEPYLSLHRVLGFYPRNIEIYRRALAHKSLYWGKDYRKREDNERMEFLGDALLSTIVSDFLYRTRTDKQEGYLSTMRSKIVQRKSLERVAAEFGIDKMLVFSRDICILEKHIFGNALEALIAAVYLDQGYEVCLKFVENEIINKHINLEELDHEELSYKTSLIEWGNKHRVKFRFEVMVGYNSRKSKRSFFRSAVVVGGVQIGYGSGSDKKDSERKASEYVYLKLRDDEAFRKHVIELSKQANEGACGSTSQTSCKSSGNPK